MNKNTYQIRTPKMIYLLSIISLIGCSGGNGGSSVSSTNPDNADSSQLQIIAPKVIYSKSGESSSGYVIIRNPSNTGINNLHYTLSNLIGGANKASIDPLSAANCSIVPANSQCNIKVIIPPQAIAGSLGFKVSTDNTLLSKLSESSAEFSIKTIGIEQVAYNHLAGADGITLSYYHTVINGTPYILVSGLIASDKVGNFNNLVLVDGKGNEIPNQVVISNTGNNTQGATYSILLPVPSGNSITQIIKAQTRQLNNGQVKVVSTANSGSTLTTTENAGIAEILPAAVYLTANNPEQIVTFSNIGDTAAQLKQLTSNNSNVEVVFSPSSLLNGATTTATLKLKNKAIAATTGNIVLNYNNGNTDTVTNGLVEQNISPIPTPTPAPTPVAPIPNPEPSPAPAPVAIPGLSAEFNPDNQFYNSTAGIDTSRQLILTNSGNSVESNITLTLPNDFEVVAGDNTPCLVNQTGHTAVVSTALNSGNSNNSCNLKVKYIGHAVVGVNSADISINYNYDNGIPAPNAVTAAVEYKVTQSTANLVLHSPVNPFDFANSLVDGAGTTDNQVFVIKNIGEIDATDLNATVNSTTLAGLFSSSNTGVSNGCGVALASGASCEYGVQFGAIPDNVSAGSKAGNLTVSYKEYSTAPATTELVANFNGQVANSGSALFNAPANGSSGAAYSGSWPNLSINQNTTGASTLISYTITNSGTDAATNFIVTLPSAPTGWNGATTNCPTVSGTNLAPNGLCTISISANTATAGTTNATAMTVGLSWQDQASPTGITQNIQIGLPKVTVIAPPAPQITAITPADNATQVATNASISITFSEPMNTSTIIPDDTIYIDYQSAYSYDSPVFSNGDQTVTITLAAGQTLGIKQSHTIYLNQTQIKSQTGFALGTNTDRAVSSFATLDGGVIFVSSSSHNGNYGGLNALNSVCTTEGASKIPSAVWQAMLLNSNVTSDANYYLFNAANSGNYYRGTLIGTGANLAPGTTTAPGALSAAIPGSGTYWYNTGYAYPGKAGSFWGTSIGNCAVWSGTGMQQSFYGMLNSTLPYLNLDQNAFLCSIPRYLICIQI